MSDDRRLIELETHCTHLQKTLDDLSDVVLAQSERIDELQRQLDRLARRSESIEQHLEEHRDPEDEKPPHY